MEGGVRINRESDTVSQQDWVLIPMRPVIIVLRLTQCGTDVLVMCHVSRPEGKKYRKSSRGKRELRNTASGDGFWSCLLH